MKNKVLLLSVLSILSGSLYSCMLLDDSEPDKEFNAGIKENDNLDVVNAEVYEDQASDKKPSSDNNPQSEEQGKDDEPSSGDQTESEEGSSSGGNVPEIEIVKKYTVTWINGDGSDLEVDNDVSEGSKPSCSKTPTKESTNEKIKYKFIGWANFPESVNGVSENELPVVNSNVTYYSVFQEVEVCIVELRSGYTSIDSNFEFYNKSYVEKGSKLDLKESDFTLPTSKNKNNKVEFLMFNGNNCSFNSISDLLNYTFTSDESITIFYIEKEMPFVLTLIHNNSEYYSEEVKNNHTPEMLALKYQYNNFKS